MRWAGLLLLAIVIGSAGAQNPGTPFASCGDNNSAASVGDLLGCTVRSLNIDVLRRLYENSTGETRIENCTALINTGSQDPLINSMAYSVRGIVSDEK
jgi:hypothetical protein